MNSCGGNNQCNKICNNSGRFVDVIGLCDVNDINIKNGDGLNFWTQIAIPIVCTIPKQKPDIEELDSENIIVQIIRKRVIITPTGPKEGNPEVGIPPYTSMNEQGKFQSGRKLVIDGFICKTLTYTALNDRQSVHTVHENTPFSTYINLPVKIPYNSLCGRDPILLNFHIIPSVEDVFITEICKRQIFQNVTLFVQALVTPGGCDELDCDNIDIVLVKGVASETDLSNLQLTATNATWTEIIISENLVIPDKNPAIEQITSLFSHVDIISQRVVLTPTPKNVANPDGTTLTGKKLIIEGVLRQKISYVANIESGDQPVHSAHFDIPFSAFIIIPRNTRRSAMFKIEPFIEDVFICAIDKRKVFKNTIIFINATQWA